MSAYDTTSSLHLWSSHVRLPRVIQPYNIHPYPLAWDPCFMLCCWYKEKRCQQAGYFIIFFSINDRSKLTTSSFHICTCWNVRANFFIHTEMFLEQILYAYWNVRANFFIHTEMFYTVVRVEARMKMHEREMNLQ